MMKEIKLHIQSPCSENFNDFKPTQKGGFCQSCSKEVIDFTKMSDEQLNQFFLNNESSQICGRLRKEQLAKTFKRKPSLYQYVAGVGLACLSFFSFNALQAQSKSNEKVNEKTITQKGEITVKGIVTENGLPLPYANVVLEGTTIGVQTDFDGKFEFPQPLKKGDVLIFNYIGFETKKVTISDKDNTLNVSLKIDLDDSDLILVGEVSVKEVYKSKKN